MQAHEETLAEKLVRREHWRDRCEQIEAEIRELERRLAQARANFRALQSGCEKLEANR